MNPGWSTPRLLAGPLLFLCACGGASSTAPSTGPSGNPALPLMPVPLNPSGPVTTDAPTFSARNARAFDGPAFQYTFEVITAGRGTLLASITVPGGVGTTEASFPANRLPRGMALAWKVTAHGSARDAPSTALGFRMPPVDCQPTRSPYAKSVVDFFLSDCSARRNSYNDPRQVLGPPNAGRSGNGYFGFMSLGERGHVDVDMEGCVVNGPVEDVRVFQSVSREPVTIYAAGAPDGPYILVADRVPCGDRLGGTFSGSCDFDLGGAEVDEARYLRIEDGELFPCDRADTDTEGADIDAIQMLNYR